MQCHTIKIAQNTNTILQLSTTYADLSRQPPPKKKFRKFLELMTILFMLLRTWDIMGHRGDD